MTATTEAPAYSCKCGCGRAMGTPAGEGRGYATPCYVRWARAGRPEDGPPPPAPRAGPREVSTKAETAQRLAHFTRLRAQGLTVPAIAAQMGIHPRAAEHYAAKWRQQVRAEAAEAQIDWPRPASPVRGVLHWSGAAACRGHQDLFFDPDGAETQRAKEIREAKARSLCAACPVRAECDDGAVSRGERWGTWGGLTEEDRAAAKRDQQREDTAA